MTGYKQQLPSLLPLSPWFHFSVILTPGFTVLSKALCDPSPLRGRNTPVCQWHCLSWGFGIHRTFPQCLWQQLPLRVWHLWGFPPSSLWWVCSGTTLQGKMLLTHSSEIEISIRETQGTSRWRPARMVITYTTLFHPWQAAADGSCSFSAFVPL